MRLLLVEDDAMIGESVRLGLRRDGFTVDWVRDGRAAELAKKDVKGMMEALAEVGYKELKKNGVFVVPGFAKFIVVKKAATKEESVTQEIAWLA